MCLRFKGFNKGAGGEWDMKGVGGNGERRRAFVRNTPPPPPPFPPAPANPVTEEIRYVQVTNLCPECHTGDLDQELNGDGRWLIEWEPVQCNVGYTSFVYSFQGSNGYYIKLQVANTRVPVRSVWWGARGKWWPMERTGDNYFQVSGYMKWGTTPCMPQRRSSLCKAGSRETAHQNAHNVNPFSAPIPRRPSLCPARPRRHPLHFQ